MIPRPGSYSPQNSRKIRPLDALLGQPSPAPTSPAPGGTTQVGGTIQGGQPSMPGGGGKGSSSPGPGAPGGGVLTQGTPSPMGGTAQGQPGSLEERQAIMKRYQDTGELPEGITAAQLTGAGRQPLSPLDAVLGGGGTEENPWLNPFMEVYEATKTGALANLEEMQKGMAERFAHRGGYFGGQHAIGQGKMAAETGTALDQLLSQVSLGASEREHQDWLRARQEEFMPMNLLSMILGQDTFENIVQQPQASQLGQILSGLFSGAGTAIASSREFKKDISEISDEDEKAIFEKLTSTPLFRYKYKFEDDGIIPHVGLITESSPKELTLFDDKAIGLGEYISALHAAIKVMSKKIGKLEGRN